MVVESGEVFSPPEEERADRAPGTGSPPGGALVEHTVGVHVELTRGVGSGGGRPRGDPRVEQEGGEAARRLDPVTLAALTHEARPGSFGSAEHAGARSGGPGHADSGVRGTGDPEASPGTAVGPVHTRTRREARLTLNAVREAGKPEDPGVHRAVADHTGHLDTKQSARSGAPGPDPGTRDRFGPDPVAPGADVGPEDPGETGGGRDALEAVLSRGLDRRRGRGSVRLAENDRAAVGGICGVDPQRESRRRTHPGRRHTGDQPSTGPRAAARLIVTSFDGRGVVVGPVRRHGSISSPALPVCGPGPRPGVRCSTVDVLGALCPDWDAAGGGHGRRHLT